MKSVLSRYLHFKKIRNTLIIEPSVDIRKEIRIKAETHLRKDFQPGTYTASHECNAIFKHMFTFYERELDRLLPTLLTAAWIGVIIYQYEESGKISAAYKRNELHPDEADHWREYGALFRQTLDYLLEKISVFTEIDQAETDGELQSADFQRALVCAEKCVGYSSVSNLTHMMLPHATTAILYPPGQPNFLKHSVHPDIAAKLISHQVQTNYEVSARDQYLLQDGNPFEFEYQSSLLNKPFQTTFGISFADYEKLVAKIGLTIRPITDPGKVPMTLKDEFYYHAAMLSELPSENVNPILDQLMLSGGSAREIWDSRQKHRINRKPFLQFVSRDRTVILWSEKKILDYLMLLRSELVFKRIPEFWKSPEITKAIDTLSNRAGSWFEKSVTHQLSKLGFKGRAISNNAFRNYPSVKFDCGQIDYLSYHPNDRAIYVFEFKLIETGFEARGARQVRDSFLSGDDAFVPVLERKIKWVKDNLATVRQFLNQECKAGIDPEVMQIRSAFITFYPTLLSVSFDRIPCVSLVQFIEDWNQHNQWSYSETAQ